MCSAPSISTETMGVQCFPVSTNSGPQHSWDILFTHTPIQKNLSKDHIHVHPHFGWFESHAWSWSHPWIGSCDLPAILLKHISRWGRQMMPGFTTIMKWLLGRSWLISWSPHLVMLLVVVSQIDNNREFEDILKLDVPLFGMMDITPKSVTAQRRKPTFRPPLPLHCMIII